MDTVEEIKARLEKGWSVGLTYLPIEDFPEIVRFAINILRDNPKHEAAQDLIADASLQAPSVLHPYLDALFELNINDAYYYADYSWRELELPHFDYLKRVILDTTKSLEERERAWTTLFATQHIDAFSFAEKAISDLGLEYFNFDANMRYVAYDGRDGRYRPLFARYPLHIIFPDSYLKRVDPPYVTHETKHPTWRLPINDTRTYRFGGAYDSLCTVCGGHLHHLITLNPIPTTLEISSLPSLTLAVCLSCLGWNWDHYKYLYYEHDESGIPRSIGYEGPQIEPEFPTEPIEEVLVQLADGGKRWRWQDWGSSEGGNLHRIGGFPSWVQDYDFPPCIKCQQPMRFIIQLDSPLPTLKKDKWAWEWGVGGMGYGLWCDQCRVSAYLLQHT